MGLCLVPVLPRDQEVLSECNTIPLCFTHLLLEEREEDMPRKPGEAYAKKRKKVQDRRYNEARPSRHGFYHSKSWREVRALYRRSHPLCEECERQGRVVVADLVHHKVEISEGGAPLDLKNLESLCHACHNRIHGGGGR